MGLFNNFFGRNNSNGSSTSIIKTSEMMDEDVYWKLIQDSIDNSTEPQEQNEFLIQQLQKYSPEEMVGFHLRTDKLLFDTYNSELWCAAYIMYEGCMDDVFVDFRYWLISKGKTVFYNAKENPDSLISLAEKEEYFYGAFIYLWSVASAAFEQKTGKSIYAFVDEDNFKFKYSDYPKFFFTWEVDDPASMRTICPKLFDAFWGQDY